MYESFFGLRELPFSIAPDPRYLYMSERHREALAHLLYGTGRDGGFVLLTGEVGTGKTTVCRCYLQKLPEGTDVAFIVHPRLTARELLATICDELEIPVRNQASVKTLIDAINAHLLKAHSQGRHVVLIIDEAQNLSSDVLEQLRLLTNLETDSKKLMQIILLGQPELLDMLARPELRQLAQRVTARYHLEALSLTDVRAYIAYRLAVAGCRRELFTPAAVRRVYRHSKGIPRLINLLCDRALLGAYAAEAPQVSARIVNTAARELGLADIAKSLRSWHRNWFVRGVAGGVLAGLLTLVLVFSLGSRTAPVTTGTLPPPSASVAPEEVSTESPVSSEPAAAPVMAAAPADSADPGRWLEKSPGDQREAWLAVIRRWHLPLPGENEALICPWLQTQGLDCLHGRGSWSTLLKIDRPAVLTLIDSRGEERYAALLAVRGEEADVVMDGQVMTLPVAAIQTRWEGRFSVAWRVPPYRSAIIRPGQERDEQRWLTGKLVRAGYREAAEGRLDDAIRALQADAGLRADGIAGAMTLIRINTLTDPTVPKLVQR